jgi:hypothetical protein
MPAKPYIPFPPSLPPAISSGGPDQILAAVSEMLERLETVTRAGQQHLMVKILGALNAHPYVLAAGPNSRSIGRQLDDLKREAEKTSPDAPTFVRVAQRLLTLIAIST